MSAGGPMGAARPAVGSHEVVFAPVRSQTALEETVDRLGTAIRLGLLAPGTRLPAERELCRRLAIARSTLHQALTALQQSGHLYATRGRGGGTFVPDPLPPASPPSAQLRTQWREVCDERTALEAGVAVLDVANDQHRRLLAAVRRGDEASAARQAAEHSRGTEHILAGLLS